MSTIGRDTPHNSNSSGRRRRAVRAAATLAAVALASTATRAADVLSTWKGNASGNWSDPTKWTNAPTVTSFPDNGQLGHTYDAAISTVTSAVTLDRNVTLRNLALSGGTIRAVVANPQTHGTNTLTVTGTFTFSAGGTAVPVRILPGGTLALSVPAVSKTTGTLYIGGTTSFAPTAGTYTLNAVGDTRLEVESTGTLALTRPTALRSPSPTDPFNTGFTNHGSIFNRGLIDQSPGADLSSHWPLYNSGTVRVNAVATLYNYQSTTGVLDLQSASARVTIEGPTVMSGSLRVAPGAVFTMSGGWGDYRDEVRGLAVTNAGTINLLGRFQVKEPTLLPGAVNIGRGNDWLYLDSDLILPGTATIFANEVRGAGRIEAANLTLRAGLKDATLHVPAGGTLEMPSVSERRLTAATLEIDGTAHWGGDILSSPATAGARINISPTGSLNIQGTSRAYLRGEYREATSRAVLTNAGLLAVDGVNSLYVTDAWGLVNSGTVRLTDVTSAWLTPGTFAMSGGVLDLRGRTKITLAPADKRFDVATSAQVLIGPTSSLIASPTNAGLIQVDRGRLEAQSLINTGTLRVTGGSYAGARFTNSGLIDLDAGAVATIDAFPSYPSFSANSPTGLLRVGPSASASFFGTSSNISLTNAGTIAVEGGRLTVNSMTANSGTIRVTAGTFEFGTQWSSGLTNTGTTEIESGGTATIGQYGQLVVAPAGVVRVNTGGALNVSPGSYASGKPFVVAGAVEVDGGRLLVTTPLNNSGTIRVAAGVARFGSPSFTNTGTIDLRPDGFALLTFGSITQSLATARAQVLSAYNGGAWDGNGILSTDAKSDPSMAVGFALARDLPAAVRQQLGNYDYLDVALRMTRYGDTTLDGLVDFTDLVRLAQNYNAANRTWGDGDFTYDGVVDFNDLVKLAQNYNTALQPAAVPGAPHSFHEDLARAFATVPEPTALPLLAPAACGLAARRRRTRKAYTNS